MDFALEVVSLLARKFAVWGFRSMTPCLRVVISTEMLNKLKLVFQLVDEAFA